MRLLCLLLLLTATACGKHELTACSGPYVDINKTFDPHAAPPPPDPTKPRDVRQHAEATP
jgi:hypothetical protein